MAAFLRAGIIANTRQLIPVKADKIAEWDEQVFGLHVTVSPYVLHTSSSHKTTDEQLVISLAPFDSKTCSEMSWFTLVSAARCHGSLLCLQ